ncbi:hypothetical protein SANTM175S_04820 [Streptomyces antimycoticus]
MSIYRDQCLARTVAPLRDAPRRPGTSWWEPARWRLGPRSADGLAARSVPGRKRRREPVRGPTGGGPRRRAGREATGERGPHGPGTRRWTAPGRARPGWCPGDGAASPWRGSPSRRSAVLRGAESDELVISAARRVRRGVQDMASGSVSASPVRRTARRSPSGFVTAGGASDRPTLWSGRRPPGQLCACAPSAGGVPASPGSSRRSVEPPGPGWPAAAGLCRGWSAGRSVRAAPTAVRVGRYERAGSSSPLFRLAPARSGQAAMTAGPSSARRRPDAPRRRRQTPRGRPRPAVPRPVGPRPVAAVPSRRWLKAVIVFLLDP